jgi:hypothetical protein
MANAADPFDARIIEGGRVNEIGTAPWFFNP